jgi:Tripartite tricarboxylate transporter family receptor
MHVRRLGIIAALAVFALGLAPSGAPAQTCTKPVRIIMPFAPGGTSDILARLIGPKLQDAIGQPVVVENKTGAGGNIGADLVAKAEKDGHTLLLIDVSTLAISPNLLASMTYSPSKDLAPIGLILFAPYVLAVHPSLAGQDHPRTGGACEGQCRQGAVRQCRDRRRQSHLRRTAGEELGRGVQARAVSGRRRCHQGHGRGREPGDPQRRDSDRTIRCAGSIARTGGVRG